MKKKRIPTPNSEKFITSALKSQMLASSTSITPTERPTGARIQRKRNPIKAKGIPKTRFIKIQMIKVCPNMNSLIVGDQPLIMFKWT
jgi:hypothetical protein